MYNILIMSVLNSADRFFDALNESILDQTFIKISLGHYKGAEDQLKQIFVRKVLIKRVECLTFTFRYKTKDITKNFSMAEGLAVLRNYVLDEFKISTLFTSKQDYILEELNSGKIIFRSVNPSSKVSVSADHDHAKNRLIKANNSNYLNALNITDSTGQVYKNAQDKFKQINHYIEILSSLIKELPEGTIKNVADMGSGKGYLTFALYDYLHHNLNLNAHITGVEYRQDMVDLCNKVADAADFKQLNFVQGTIEDYNPTDVNLLIALHACDTATDDAIYKGIKANAALIVVAPCCHKQIRKEMEKNKAANDLDFLTKYGIFLERQAEMVTDGIRALILEYFGYKTKVFQFIADAHTPKNVMVVGIKSKSVSKDKQAEILEKIKSRKEYFGIGYHHLEKLLNL